MSYIEKNMKRKNNKLVQTFSDQNHPIEIDHALVASIFSALAVEARLNVYIERKMLRFVNSADKKFKPLGRWIIGEKKWYKIEKKVEFVNKLNPRLKLSYSEDGFKELFEYRNEWVHFSGDLFEGDTFTLKKGKVIKEFQRSLRYKPATLVEIGDAKKHFKLAEEIIKKFE